MPRTTVIGMLHLIDIIATESNVTASSVNAQLNENSTEGGSYYRFAKSNQKLDT